MKALVLVVAATFACSGAYAAECPTDYFQLESASQQDVDVVVCMKAIILLNGEKAELSATGRESLADAVAKAMQEAAKKK